MDKELWLPTVLKHQFLRGVTCLQVGLQKCKGWGFGIWVHWVQGVQGCRV